MNSVLNNNNCMVNLDYAASTPLRMAAKQALEEYQNLECAGANPNSLHSLGRQAARLLDGARKDLTQALNAGFRPHDCIFVSSGTEANNLALFGISRAMHARQSKRNVICISAIEHDSILKLIDPLSKEGFEVRILPVTQQGVVDLEAAQTLIDERCALVSVMYVNNETGAIQPVHELVGLAHKAGAVMHTDAAQALTKIPLMLKDIDAVSIAAHKVGGPVGVAALVMRANVACTPLIYGGGQERGLRSSTQDVAGARAFAAAVCDGMEHLQERSVATLKGAQYLYESLCGANLPFKATITSAPEYFNSALQEFKATDSCPMEPLFVNGIVSVISQNMNSEELILRLDNEGFAVSAASACSAQEAKPSHVLLAQGYSKNEASRSLRISFDERISQDDLKRFVAALTKICR